jgi:hypothetical protein
VVKLDTKHRRGVATRLFVAYTQQKYIKCQPNVIIIIIIIIIIIRFVL